MKIMQLNEWNILSYPESWPFWQNFVENTWEPGTVEVILEHAKGKRMADIGAWVGPTVLIALAAGAEHVRAFEPDPVAFGVLSTNMLLNGVDNVELRPEAVAPAAGSVRLRCDDLGESMTGSPEAEHSIEVPAVTVAEACADAEFVKVDIEGAEFDLFDEFADLDVPVLMAMHPQWWPGEPDLPEWSKVYNVGPSEVLCIP